MSLHSPAQVIRELEQQLNTCMLVDRFPLKRRLHQARELFKQEKPAQQSLSDIARKIQLSQQHFQTRLSNLPKPAFPLELPVSGKKAEIAQAILNNQVVIVCGETGSGKTTQLPKICLELGRGVAGLIGHTQPRRIAARSVASRIAQELASPLGEVVGYKVRFNDKVSDKNYIKLMTDGILLAETQSDKFLNAYDTIIIDEAHERSLNIDFLLGYLKQLLPKRPDLKVIVTSATIDADRFSKHFNGAPVIEVSGRTFPVEIRYRPLGSKSAISQLKMNARQQGAGDETVYEMRRGADNVANVAGASIQKWQDDDDLDIELLGQDVMGVKRMARTESRWLEEDDEEEAIEEAILDAADDLLRQGDGDILVFLPGEREIRDTAEHLRKYQGRSAKLKHIEVLPLFARLSIEDQQKIFRAGGQRRIVLATNVAETSLTVPGIKYVIDAGLARVNRYSTRAKVEQLQIEKISQAAAKQRAGRCGRVSNGICVRLYSEEDFNHRPAFTDPEILRSSLASVILRMADLRLGDVAEFPFIEAPSSKLITDGYQLLQELGAVNEKREITEIGRQMARLPLDPRVARMILSAKREGCLKEILIIASVLSIQDPRERPMDKREAADQAHAKFHAENSDFMSYLKIWDWAENAFKNKKSNKDLLNQCHQNFLSFLRLKEWRELYAQLLDIAEEMEFKLSEKTAPENVKYESIHKALLSGLLGNIGFKDGESETYAGARGIRFTIAPGSSLKKSRPKWVMAAELVDTTKLYARCVAKIEPDWIEPLARGLTQSTYTDPRWDRKMGMVNAWERVSLYGLTIIPKRRVHYGPINPAESREIFIREALANGEFDTKAQFFKANVRLIAEVEELEHKARRQDVLVDEHQLFAFYDAKIPADIFNAASFEKWRQEAEKLNPKLLYLTRNDLMRHGADAITAVQFPEKMLLDGVEVPLKYRFEPGHVLDGVTATIPLALLNQLDPVQTEWLVPGMLREKLTYLIKALPKTFRRVCVPVPEFVTGFLEHAQIGQQAIMPCLADYILQKTTLKVSLTDWGEIPAHLLMNFSVVDDAGKELAMGRDWHLLKKQLGSAAQLTFRNSSSDSIKNLEKTGLKQWDFGDLPETLSFERDGRKMTGYPALEDQGESVSVKLFDTEREAQVNLRKGVCRLMRFELKEQMKQLEKSLPNFNQYALTLRNIMTPDELREDLLSTISDRAFIGEDALPRSNDEFMKLKQRARARLPAVTDAVTRQAQQIANEYQLLIQQQAKMPATVNRLKKDVEQQIQNLVYKKCFSQTPWQYLQHLPRYLKALRLRIEKHPNNPERDGKNAASVAMLWQKWQDKITALQDAHLEVSHELQDFRWLMEELRVSLFAQELKTPFPISIKRLEKTWAEISHA
jgi:ATP-dependent helicase HrpA